jgi:WhiB family redox-sensing transcriptional regulator
MIPASRAWRDRAACRDMDVDLFFPLGAQEASPKAIAACAGCPVRRDCLDYGIGEGDGVWGGLTEPERRALRRRTTRAARRVA